MWYCRGGLCRIADALAAAAARCGVRFIYGAEVARVDVRGGRAAGVVLRDGTRLAADVVVANVDLPYVYRHMLPDQDLGA